MVGIVQGKAFNEFLWLVNCSLQNIHSVAKKCEVSHSNTLVHTVQDSVSGSKFSLPAKNTIKRTHALLPWQRNQQHQLLQSQWTMVNWRPLLSGQLCQPYL